MLSYVLDTLEIQSFQPGEWNQQPVSLQLQSVQSVHVAFILESKRGGDLGLAEHGFHKKSMRFEETKLIINTWIDLV